MSRTPLFFRAVPLSLAASAARVRIQSGAWSRVWMSLLSRGMVSPPSRTILIGAKGFLSEGFLSEGFFCEEFLEKNISSSSSLGLSDRMVFAPMRIASVCRSRLFR